MTISLPPIKTSVTTCRRTALTENQVVAILKEWATAKLSMHSPKIEIRADQDGIEDVVITDTLVEYPDD